MIELEIPGRGKIHLEHVVFDVNGTLAVDGRLLEGVAGKVGRLRERLQIHLLTADTHGRQDFIDVLLSLKAARLKPGGEAGQKADFVRNLGAESVVAVGNGANDAEMLKAAAIGIAVIGGEGLAVEALQAADVVCRTAFDALDLLHSPRRLVATLRR